MLSIPRPTPTGYCFPTPQLRQDAGAETVVAHQVVTRRLQIDAFTFDTNQRQHFLHKVKHFAAAYLSLGFTHGGSLQKSLQVFAAPGRVPLYNLPY